jgi:hypothetical protein
MIRIDDDNALDIASQTAQEHPPGCAEDGTFRSEPIGTYSGIYGDAFPLIPESEWVDRIQYMNGIKGFIGQRWQPDPAASYQNGYSWCWAYSLTQAVEGARAGMDQPFVQLAPESLLELVGYHNKGYYCDKALAYAKEHGIAERRLVKQYSERPKDWGDYRTNAKMYCPTETWDGQKSQMWAETVTALLSGFGCYVGYDWWSHAVFLDGLVLDGTKIGVHTPNTHGPGKDATLFGSKAVPSEMFVIRQATYTG